MREAIDISSGPALLSTLLGLAVDPTHLRDLHAQAARAAGLRFPAADAAEAAVDTPGAERRRRVRDAVEAALSDVILLGTEPQVRLAAKGGGGAEDGRKTGGRGKGTGAGGGAGGGAAMLDGGGLGGLDRDGGA